MWKRETQSCNKSVYSFFLQSVIYIALLFYIEHYLVAIHYLRKLYKNENLSSFSYKHKRQVNNVVYKCDVTRSLPKKVYLGLAEGEWKSPFYNHKLSFKHKRYSNKTILSSYMWHLKSVSSETPNLKWSILRCVPPYSNISKKCLLCLYEKLEIVTYQNQKELLNKRSELFCNLL